MQRRIHGLVVLALAGHVSSAEELSLDFHRPQVWLEGPAGASCCQFQGYAGTSVQLGNVWADYSSLNGFPDDAAAGDYKAFCDTAFSTCDAKGMGLSQLWATPTVFQTPPGAVGGSYAAVSWRDLDFADYEAGTVLAGRYRTIDGRTAPASLRGHTVAMFQAALRRARAENQRLDLWLDVHHAYPRWLRDSDTAPIAPERYAEAALHLVCFAKYLIARHGIPIHALSVQNEPVDRAAINITPWTAEGLLRFAIVVRAKLDEAGLNGIRIIPGAWNGKQAAELQRQYELLASEPAYASVVDYLSFHSFSGGEAGPQRDPLRPLTYSSGTYTRQWPGAKGLAIGADTRLDEVIRLGAQRFASGIPLVGYWQVGGVVANIPSGWMGAGFRPSLKVQDAYATVYPFVRPGMAQVAGSTGAGGPAASWSVDGYGGHGHREAVVIANDAVARTFAITLVGLTAASARIYQATATSARQDCGRIPIPADGRISLSVPADSVTTLVAETAASRPRIYLVVGATADLSAEDAALRDGLAACGEVVVVPQELAAADQGALATLRHPVDPFGAAAYVLAPSVDRQAVAYAHRAVMAPVLVLGEACRAALGLESARRIDAGEALACRDPRDPPAELLAGGLPLACGRRSCLPAGAASAAVQAEVAWALAGSGLGRGP